MKVPTISFNRLANQQLTASRFSQPGELVKWMGAIQAQDYAMSKWAIGSRLTTGNEAAIESAIDKGEIIRTHIMRPTWHVVASSDCRWMLQLTAPNIKRLARTQEKQLGLNDAIFRKTNRLITKLLEGRQMTRAEIMTELGKSRLSMNSLQAAHVMLHAELDQIVCNGARRGKQFTYAVFDERIPASRPIPHDEALKELATRYFTSHGPAMLTDFVWWSGLSITDARTGLEAAKRNLQSAKIDGVDYWHAGEIAVPDKTTGQIILLPSFDEFIIGYSDRSASMDVTASAKAILANGIFKPVVVVDGRVAGTWKRTEQKDKLLLEVEPLKKQHNIKKRQFAVVGERYGKFVERKIVTTFRESV